MVRIRIQELTLILLLALIVSGTRAAPTDAPRSLFIQCQLHSRSACEPLKRAFFDRQNGLERIDSESASMQVRLRDEPTDQGIVVHSTWISRLGKSVSEISLPDLVLQDPEDPLAVQQELVSFLSWGVRPHLELGREVKKPWKIALVKAPDDELHLVPVRVQFDKKKDDPFDFEIVQGVRVSTTGVYPFLKKKVTLPTYLQFINTLSKPDPYDQLIYPDRKVDQIAIGVTITVGRGGAIFSGKRKKRH